MCSRPIRGHANRLAGKGDPLLGAGVTQSCAAAAAAATSMLQAEADRVTSHHSTGAKDSGYRRRLPPACRRAILTNGHKSRRAAWAPQRVTRVRCTAPATHTAPSGAWALQRRLPNRPRASHAGGEERGERKAGRRRRSAAARRAGREGSALAFAKSFGHLADVSISNGRKTGCLSGNRRRDTEKRQEGAKDNRKGRKTGVAGGEAAAQPLRLRSARWAWRAARGSGAGRGLGRRGLQCWSWGPNSVAPKFGGLLLRLSAQTAGNRDTKRAGGRAGCRGRHRGAQCPAARAARRRRLGSAPPGRCGALWGAKGGGAHRA